MRIAANYFQPRFGFGGVDASNQPRPLPTAKDYRYTLRPGDVAVSRKGQFHIHPQFVRTVYEQVFRKNLEAPGFVLINGLSEVFRQDMKTDMKKVRAFQVALGEELGKMRSQVMRLEGGDGFSLKYVGRSNKAKRNPMHMDTQSTDALVLMIYEPMKNVRAYPFFADMTQYAVDKGVLPLNMLSREHGGDDKKLGYEYKVKAHYGHQIEEEHQPELLEKYTVDLDGLDCDDLQLVIFNDSVGLESKGLAHGMRKMEVANPEQSIERFFNHTVFDVRNHELYRPAQGKSDRPSTYYAKGTPEAEQTPASYKETINQYIRTGRIFYRNPKA